MKSQFMLTLFSKIFKIPEMLTIDETSTTVQKMKFSVKDLFSKCDQIRSFLMIWSHLLKKSLMENFIFCAVHKVNKKVTK